MTRRPARVSVVTQPGATQFTSLLDAKPCTSTIGSPSPSSRKAISTPSWVKYGIARPYDPIRRAQSRAFRTQDSEGNTAGRQTQMRVAQAARPAPIEITLRHPLGRGLARRAEAE